jgi:hypothetical protein
MLYYIKSNLYIKWYKMDEEMNEIVKIKYRRMLLMPQDCLMNTGKVGNNK